ncbi:MAG: 23S rRNA (guanosine2251-2'-O)-methyltransferase [Bradymonadia bacterium]|jgi:23S rRNA (guanosine2251-2'-O)-methyltransferase
MSHPRDRYITVYGRNPVLEALEDSSVKVDKVLLARGLRGPVIKAIARAAKTQKIQLTRVDTAQINRISRNSRQDQGVVADVIAPHMGALTDQLEAVGAKAAVLVLDGITTPGNVGMILRSATAAGLDGIVLPRHGSPEVGPLVIKASAGVAFRAPIWRAATAFEAVEALKAAGFVLVGLAGDAEATLFEAPFPDRVAFVLGNETTGMSPEVLAEIDLPLSIPMEAGVESLNVAAAATVLAFEVQRRRRLTA